MKKADVVIVGGSAAGPTAGISCRRRYPDKSVILIRKEEKVLVPCGIPYVFGTVGSPEKNLIPDALLDKNGIELLKGEVVSLERDKKIVSLANGDEIGYDKLVLATGSQPLELPIPGLDKENVFSVKKDVAYLSQMLDTMNQVKNVTIIGGGFIGVEFADECRKHRDCEDCSVTIIEILPRCLKLALDDEFCQEAEDVLVGRGVKVLTNKKVESIMGDGKVSGVRLSDGQELSADMVIIGVGARPDTRLAEAAGLEIGLARGIRVDRHMRTLGDENVFACGDCAEKVSFFSGKLSRLMLASIATGEARVAGANLYGICYSNPGAVGVFCTVIGERAFGCAGLGEAVARREGYNVVVGQSAGPDRHPGSMPGAANVKLKLVFCKEKGLLLGGSASGGTSIGELMNLIGACIQHSVTAYDMAVFQMGTHP
ncbi:MAG TPA: FAD-dependent oxidoreductase, partial [Dehalococcoidia bacterium]|nr:FAD-dependent oxidoreductase [Dehalococcoidia bacterium]